MEVRQGQSIPRLDAEWWSVRGYNILWLKWWQGGVGIPPEGKLLLTEKKVRPLTWWNRELVALFCLLQHNHWNSLDKYRIPLISTGAGTALGNGSRVDQCYLTLVIITDVTGNIHKIYFRHAVYFSHVSYRWLALSKATIFLSHVIYRQRARSWLAAET